jgi:hypothetical protein
METSTEPPLGVGDEKMVGSLGFGGALVLVEPIPFLWLFVPTLLGEVFSSGSLYYFDFGSLS